MQGTLSNLVGKMRRHPGARSELLAVLSIAVMAVVAYTLWPRPAPPADSPAASAAVSGSEFSDAQKHQAEMRRLANLNEMLYPSEAADQRTDQQIDREEQWIRSHAVSADASVPAIQRQEELKDQWLERRSGAASVAQSARTGPVPECDEACINAYSQQFRDLQQLLNERPAPLPACDEVCLNAYSQQLRELEGLAQPARRGPVPECDEVCINAYSQQFRDLQQMLNERPAPLPACDEVCINAYSQQLRELEGLSQSNAAATACDEVCLNLYRQQLQDLEDGMGGR